MTIILLLFGTTTLVQAFVIPTGSMEDSLLIGDHLLVDKLAYSPAGSLGQYLLPYQDVQRGDIIVFRYPVDLTQTFVKRVVGVPGDRIRILSKHLFINGDMVDEPFVEHKTSHIDGYRDNFPSNPNMQVYEQALDMLENHVENGEVVVPEGRYFALGDNRDLSLDSRYWGFVPREKHHRQAVDHLLVLRCPDRETAGLRRIARASQRPGAELLYENPLESQL